MSITSRFLYEFSNEFSMVRQFEVFRVCYLEYCQSLKSNSSTRSDSVVSVTAQNTALINMNKYTFFGLPPSAIISKVPTMGENKTGVKKETPNSPYPRHILTMRLFLDEKSFWRCLFFFSNQCRSRTPKVEITATVVIIPSTMLGLLLTYKQQLLMWHLNIEFARWCSYPSSVRHFTVLCFRRTFAHNIFHNCSMTFSHMIATLYFILSSGIDEKASLV